MTMIIRTDVYRAQLGCVAMMTMLITACSGGGDSGTPASAASSSTPSTAPATSSTPTSTSSANTSALRITGEPTEATSLGAAYYFKATVTGNAAGAVTYSIRNKPEWATLNTVTGELKGTPTVTGTFANISINASDGRTTATLAPFSIRVLDEQVRVTLNWAAPTKNTDGSDLDNLSGFAIHYGTSASALNKVVKVASKNARSYLFTDLEKGTTYYFAVAAVNDMNVEGSLSPVTSIAL